MGRVRVGSRSSRADGWCPPSPKEGLEELGLPPLQDNKNKKKRKIPGSRLAAGVKNVVKGVVGAVVTYTLVKRPGRKSIVLKPPEDSSSSSAAEDAPETLLVVLCGGKVAPEHYVDVCKEVQKHSKTKLWVVIPKFFKDLSFEKSARVMYERAIEMARDEGFDEEKKLLQTESVFVMGHSWGGYMARNLALEKSAGLILLNSWLGRFREPIRALMMEETRFSTDVAEYSKPFLVLSGDRDGQMRMGYLAEALYSALDYTAKTGCDPTFTAKHKGVVCLRGVNHSIHVNDDPNYARGDTRAGVEREEALEQVATAMADFLDCHRMSSPSAADALMGRVRDTEDLLAPLIAAGTGRTDDGQIRHLASLAQEKAANVSGLDRRRICVAEYDDFKDFVYSKPQVFQPQPGSTGDARIMVSALRVWDESGMGGVNNCRNRCSPEVWIKMKSQEYCCQSPLMMGGMKAKGEPGSARDINEETFAQALDLVSSAARERYEEEGRKLVFAPDKETGAGPPWLAAPMEYAPSEDGESLVLTCPGCKSPMEGVPDRFAGMHYIKVPSLASMVEYILVDAFIQTDALLYVQE